MTEKLNDSTMAVLPASTGSPIATSIASVGLAMPDSAQASQWMPPSVLDSSLHLGAYLGSSSDSAPKIPSGLECFAALHKFDYQQRYGFHEFASFLILASF